MIAEYSREEQNGKDFNNGDIIRFPFIVLSTPDCPENSV